MDFAREICKNASYPNPTCEQSATHTSLNIIVLADFCDSKGMTFYYRREDLNLQPRTYAKSGLYPFELRRRVAIPRGSPFSFNPLDLNSQGNNVGVLL